MLVFVGRQCFRFLIKPILIGNLLVSGNALRDSKSGGVLLFISLFELGRHLLTLAHSLPPSVR